MASDRIAVLYSSKPDPDQHPRAYFFVTEAAPTTWQSGSGKARFWLPLLREAVTFAYIRENAWRPGIWWSYSTLARVTLLPPSNTKIPHNIRLSFKNSNAVAAIWQTAGVTPDAAVRWRLAGSTYTSGTFGTRMAAANTYRAGDMCSTPADDDAFSPVGMIYSAVINNLQPGKRYYYQVGSPTSGWSQEMSFAAAPGPGNLVAETRFILTADIGQYSPDQARYPDGTLQQYLRLMPSDAATPGNKAYAATQALLMTMGAGPGQQPATKPVYNSIVRQMKLKEYHAFISNGDLSYARGEAHQWDTWGVQTQPITSFIPTIYSPGKSLPSRGVCGCNHEAVDKSYPNSPFDGIDSGGECNIPYRNLLQMPQPAGPAADWFAISIGPVRFIQLNSEQNIKPGSRQYKDGRVDRDRNAVSVTSTVNTVFGSGVVSESTGIVFNNEMDDFSQPNRTSLVTPHPSPANFIAPGRRPLSAMSPFVVAERGGGRLVAVAGASGGPLIVSATLQTLARLLLEGADVSDAVASTRMHDQLLPLPTKTFFEGNDTWFPSRPLPPHVLEQLEGWGQDLEGQRFGLGVSQAVAVRYDGDDSSGGGGGEGDGLAVGGGARRDGGVLVAMSDARKDGAPFGVL